MTFPTFQFHKQEALLEMQLMNQRGKEANQKIKLALSWLVRRWNRFWTFPRMRDLHVSVVGWPLGR